MDAALRQAWTDVVTADDYEQHMATIGQAQAAADLTRQLLERASLAPGQSVTIAGAGTGQMFDFLDGAIFRPYDLKFTDLNPMFLERLRVRLEKLGLAAQLLLDDFEQSQLTPGTDLLLATLLLEHIDWRQGVATIGRVRPGAVGLILQENPAGMTSAITPGRRIPLSIARASETAHPTLVVRRDLIDAMSAQGYCHHDTISRPVADDKYLIALLFVMSASISA